MSKIININKEINPDTTKHRDKYTSNIEYSFADRLNYVMLVKNITNVQLADETYCATSTIAGYRTGARVPNAIMIKEICRSLDVSADYLLGLSVFSVTLLKHSLTLHFQDNLQPT